MANTFSAALVAGVFLVGGSASAAVVFDFTADSTFDCAGIGASETRKDVAAGKSVTLKTIDIIGLDGTSTSKGADHQSFINTKVDALGINSEGSGFNGLEFQDFNPGEAWIISFDVDVNLVEIDLASQDAGAEITLSSSAFPDQVLEDGLVGDVHDLNSLLVPAGTPITIKMTSSASAADTSMRISRFTVAAASSKK